MKEDTLSGRTLGVLAGWCGRLHLLCVGKLREKTCFEILSALILLPTVDEHFVLKDNKDNSEILDMHINADTQSCKQVLICTHYVDIRYSSLFYEYCSIDSIHFIDHLTGRIDPVAKIH